jgi:hypothetical protein
MKKLFLFNILVIVFGLALVHADDSDAFSPYLDAAEHTISAQEYSDLKAYVERAQKILSNTLENSTAFSGAELHSHLLKGVELALRNTDLRGELLLFRYVLVRAVEVDRIYNDARTPTTTESEAAQLSSLVILIPAIESALSYYQTSDLPRLATTVVPSPNWQEFAADQVPHLLRAIDLAPSKTARAKMARTAVGWSAKALNSALERRTAETADLIVQLGELYNDPNLSHPTFVARAQETLLKVYKTFKKPLTTVAVAPATSGARIKNKK